MRAVCFFKCFLSQCRVFCWCCSQGFFSMRNILISLVSPGLFKLRTFLKKLPSCSYYYRKHSILDRFVINILLRLVSLLDMLLFAYSNRKHRKQCTWLGFFSTCIHGALGHVSFGYLFLCFICYWNRSNNYIF